MHAQRKPSVSTSRVAAATAHVSDPMTRWELQRAERGGEYRREVTGNVIRYLPLPPAPTVPCPGEDGEPPAMSERWFNFGLVLLGIGAVMVGFFQKAGLL